jgi:hypothetical protein
MTMKKNLITSLFFVLFFAACGPDQVEPTPEPTLVPYAIYRLDNADYDTSFPKNTTKYTYTSEGLVSTIIFRSNDPNVFDRNSKIEYDQKGELASVFSIDNERLRTDFMYQDGKVRLALSNFSSSGFLFDGANRIQVRIDSSGPRGGSLRADNLLYSYTDSGITIRRIIHYLMDNVKGEAQPNYLFFDKTYRNPFEKVKSDLQYVPFYIIGLTDHLRYRSSVGFLGKYKMVNKSGREDISLLNTVVKVKQGTNYPELIKVNYLYFGVPSEYYLYILYREL